ncbi:MAG: Rrf2 family transcriptional regulator [Deltaproteobacteria bacterium]|nr:Rrf2 family transcriptional regulator [Deltaproteobacteria bacterium]MBI3389261.1 Rrf2 family transcriptional regulator [Deltaproteobacteria bacterium]
MTTKRALRSTRAHRSSIMNVGRRVDYAVRALSYLAGQPSDRVVSRVEIQQHQAIPPHFLSKILRALVNAGFLDSVSGSHGGFRLTRAPDSISIREVYESVERPLSLIDCVELRGEFCQFAPVCTQIDVWAGAQQMLADYLARITISDIADQPGLVARLRG